MLEHGLSARMLLHLEIFLLYTSAVLHFLMVEGAI